MKTLSLVILLLTLTTKSTCQIRPVINASYDVLFLTAGFSESQFGAGTRFNDHWFLELNFRHSVSSIAFGTSSAMKNEIISLSSGYRLLSEDHKVSPIFILDIGTPIHSNANNTLMENYFWIEKEYYSGMWKYNRGIVFGKFKFMYDRKIKSFDLLIGASYNLFIFSKSNLKPSSWIPTPEGYEITKTINIPMSNFGIEASLMYTIPSKKEK